MSIERIIELEVELLCSIIMKILDDFNGAKYSENFATHQRVLQVDRI